MVDRVFTQPPRRAGRGKKLKPSPVQLRASADNVDVVTPTHLKDSVHLFDDLDVLVVAAYGLILPKAVLATPTHGCINVHASLLPRWRGASPIEHTILHGDTNTGVTIMKVAVGVDSGPVYSRQSLELNGRETLESLSLDLAEMGAVALIRVLEKLQARELPVPVPQDETQATYAPRLDPRDAMIDWSASASHIERRVRAFNGRGGAYAFIDKTRLLIRQARVAPNTLPAGELRSIDGAWLVGCGEGCLALDVVQLTRGSGKPMSAQAAANGHRDVFQDGVKFDTP